MPLELFVLVGTFIEELFSPIPSFMVLVPTGAIAHAQDRGLLYLGVLAVFSAMGRIAAAAILYKLADTFEDRLLAKGRRIFGLSHTEIEGLDRRLNRAGKYEGIVLFVMNAIPIFPTGALSLACGFIKIRFRLFIICTFFGTMINALIYMSIGYGGVKAASALSGLELASKIVVAVLILTLVAWLIHRRRGGRHAPTSST
ncbi:MAG TPA: VTT domain-containing protein [Candidatus Saccharimonadales bacterium]|nr:VTT domain-containing protein [Candidatus Saccharimonadales bacterium]